MFIGLDTGAHVLWAGQTFRRLTHYKDKTDAWLTVRLFSVMVRCSVLVSRVIDPVEGRQSYHLAAG